MLAYVFWHQRASHVAKERYQEKLIAFHQILQERQPQGFVSSVVLEIARLPWMSAGDEEVYEDWYLVENSAALDPLDTVALSESCREPHQQIARLAGQGTGGLYRLKEGSIDRTRAAEVRFVTWFSKPAGMRYETLYASLPQQQDEPQGMVWQRQMTMGPALEFCWQGPQKRSWAAELGGIEVEAHPIFPVSSPGAGREKE